MSRNLGLREMPLQELAQRAERGVCVDCRADFFPEPFVGDRVDRCFVHVRVQEQRSLGEGEPLVAEDDEGLVGHSRRAERVQRRRRFLEDPQWAGGALYDLKRTGPAGTGEQHKGSVSSGQGRSIRVPDLVTAGRSERPEEAHDGGRSSLRVLARERVPAVRDHDVLDSGSSLPANPDRNGRPSVPRGERRPLGDRVLLHPRDSRVVDRSAQWWRVLPAWSASLQVSDGSVADPVSVDSNDSSRSWCVIAYRRPAVAPHVDVDHSVAGAGSAHMRHGFSLPSDPAVASRPPVARTVRSCRPRRRAGLHHYCLGTPETQGLCLRVASRGPTETDARREIRVNGLRGALLARGGTHCA